MKPVQEQNPGESNSSRLASWLLKGRSHLGLEIARRIALLFLVLGLCQFIVVTLASRRILRAFEQQQVMDRTRQALLVLNREALSLRSVGAANAASDRMYDFVQHPDPGFIDRKFSGNWPKTHDIDFLLVLSMDGRRIWSSDGDPSFPMAVPDVFAKPIFQAEDRYAFPFGAGPWPSEAFVGVVGSGSQVWVYCAHPITDDGMVRTPNGMLICGRLLDAEMLSDLALGEGDSLSFVPFEAAPPESEADDKESARQFPILGGLRTSVRHEKDRFVTYTPMLDVANQPVATFRLAVPNTIERTGERLILLASGLLFVIAALTCLGILLVVAKTVVRPVAVLQAFFSAHREGREGVLDLDADRNDEIGALAQDAKDLMTTVLQQKAELETQANTDRLTGLANRRYFELHVKKELRRQMRQQRANFKSAAMAAVVVDVDYFKRYNDSMGHMAGDACLKAIAESIQACIFRPGDLACRFGGEEFVLVLPNTDEVGALVVSESVRQSVEWMALPHPDSPVAPVVTVSVGAAAMDVVEGFKVETLIERADRALYRAKDAGRNRAVGDSSLELNSDPRVTP